MEDLVFGYGLCALMVLYLMHEFVCRWVLRPWAQKHSTPYERPEGLERPELERPEVKKRLERPESEGPELERPEPENPKFERPETKEPELERPKPESLKFERPKVKEPELECPKLKRPEVKEPECPELERRELVGAELERPEVKEPERFEHLDCLWVKDHFWKEYEKHIKRFFTLDDKSFTWPLSQQFPSTQTSVKQPFPSTRTSVKQPFPSTRTSVKQPFPSTRTSVKQQAEICLHLCTEDLLASKTFVTSFCYRPHNSEFYKDLFMSFWEQYQVLPSLTKELCVKATFMTITYQMVE